jgi:hypothetical protein
MEHDEQVTFFEWVRLNREFAPNSQVRKAMRLCYSNQTGAHMSKAHAAKMKAEGMTKGILDINLDWPIWKNYLKENDLPCRDNCFPGLRIEMKFGKNKLTPEQKEIKKLLEEAGHKVVVCYSAQEAVSAVYEYLPFKAGDYQGIKEFL